MARDMNLQIGIKGIKAGTDIRDIKVPEALRQRRLTGITWFDDAIGGEGMVPSTVTMLTGMPGSGKSTLFRQMADSIVGQGHICIYNTGEESLYQVKMCFERLGLKNGFQACQFELATDLLEYADQVRKDPQNKGKQVFMLQDSLQTMNDGKYKDGGMTGNTPVRVCEMLTDWCKQTYGIAMFIGQSTKSGDFAGKNTIKHAVDAHCNIYFEEDKKSEIYGERVFEVTKNRWGCNQKSYIIGLAKKGLEMKGHFSKSGAA